MPGWEEMGMGVCFGTTRPGMGGRGAACAACGRFTKRPYGCRPPGTPRCGDVVDVGRGMIGDRVVVLGFLRPAFFGAL